MNTSILRSLNIFLAVFLPLLACCQYLPFELETVYHFEQVNGRGQQYPLVIDTIIDHGTHQTFVPFRMVQDSLEVCVRDSQHHWVGDRIDVYPDGKHVFHLPYDYNSFEIMSFAKLGERWLGTDLDTSKIEVGVISHEVEMIQGISDSIKTFKFFHVDANGILINDRISDMEIKLAKNAGYLTVVNFGVWPREESNIYYNDFGESNRSDYQNLTFEEVNDFQIGDEFHIYTYHTDYGILWSKYFDKLIVLSKQEDTSQYVYAFERMQRRESGMLYNDTIDVVETIDTFIRSFSKQKPYFDEVALRPFSMYSWAIQFNVSYDGAWGKSKNYAVLAYGFNPYEKCLEYFIETTLVNSYIEGKGGPYYYENTQIGLRIRELKYFKNDSIEMGQRLDSFFTATQETHVQNNDVLISISPNPSSEQFNISWQSDAEMRRIEIRDLRGQLIERFELEYDMQSAQLNFDHAPGVYLCRLIDIKGRSYSTKLVKQ